MATFDTDGVDALIQQMQKLGNAISGETLAQACKAGAQVVKQAWKATAIKHDFKDTGAMIDSINYPREPQTVNAAVQLVVYPQGKDKRGERNAAKAYRLHYGWSKFPATHWVDEAEKLAEQPALKAMRDVIVSRIEKIESE